jgi:Na+-translocating ferredoxin:NAD+ oxidoreductase RnfC subunit
MSDLLDAVRDAGVVGAGGAGFPTHAKYAVKSPADLFLINGAECEPLLKSDQYVMAHFPERLCKAALAVKDCLKAKRLIFVLKAHYTEQIKALKAAAAKTSGIEFKLLDQVYPAGDEQFLLYEASGRIVPPGGLPIAAGAADRRSASSAPGRAMEGAPLGGAVVSNAGTMLAVADALEGKPVTHRYLTVAGEVAKPTVIRAPIGMSFAECVKLAGGATVDKPFVLAGGPLMGKSVNDIENESVTKTTSGIIVLPAGHYLERRRAISIEHIQNRARSACIQCSTCSDMCPRRLLGSPLRPHLVMRALAASTDMDELLKTQAAQSAMLCCECGICETYACPM